MRTVIGTTVMILLGGTAVLGQSWCPSGAKWMMNEHTVDWGSGYSTEGFILDEYVGDTLIGGVVAHQIKGTRFYREQGSTEPYVQGSAGIKFTYSQDGVVFIQYDDSFGPNNAFDTLFWFGADPGDQWMVPDGILRFTVLDTATVLINGESLRRFAVEVADADNVHFASDTLYERIGLLYGYSFNPSTYMADGVSIGFRCYQDNVFSFTRPDMPDCDFTVGLPEWTSSGATIWPNPSYGRLYVDTGQLGATELRVLDHMGRTVHHSTILGVEVEYDLHHLAPGTYWVLVRYPDGDQLWKWIKL
ncbi:MAG TPA: T9SS type A sorting domain-containing protein [Flavobacteriales bacterium]|nr:T9SS type A sorting domain-containing protein [Flavobacteriales bacterium]